MYTWKTKLLTKHGKWDNCALSLRISGIYMFHFLQKSLIIELENIQKSVLHLLWCFSRNKWTPRLKSANSPEKVNLYSDSSFTQPLNFSRIYLGTEMRVSNTQVHSLISRLNNLVTWIFSYSYVNKGSLGNWDFAPCLTLITQKCCDLRKILKLWLQISFFRHVRWLNLV